MTCNVKLNSISHLKKKGLIDENMIIKNAMFFNENNILSNLARSKYGVTNQNTLFNWEDVNEKTTKAVPNEEFFNELQQKFDLQNNELQSDKEPLLQTKESSEKMKKASPKTLRKLKEFLKRIGVDLKTVPYITHNGQRLDANGIAEIFGNLIWIVEGKENVALPEEAMHFATYLIRQTNKELYKKLLNSVSSTPEYEEFFSEYAKRYRTHDDKPDIPKIKFEIIGKVLANQYVANENKTWLQWIIEAIKNLFVKANIDPFAEALQGLDKLESVENIRIESIVEDIRQGVKGTMWEQGFKELSPEQILRESYEQIKSAGVSYIDQALSGNDELADEIVDFYENMTFLQVTPETIVKKLDETNRKVVNKTVVNDKTGEAESDYYIDGKKVKDRVTRKIKRVMKFEFRDRKITPWQKQMEDQMREWGSKGHKDLERLFKKYLKADGTIEIVRNDEGQDVLKPQNDIIVQSEMDPEDLGIFEVLEKNVVNILMSYPEGTKFRVEQVIYTQNGGEVGQRDLAGTIDFLAIKPNGKVDVLDWKFTRINKDKYDDLGWFKQNEWKMQMEEYRKILKKEYGILESQFEKTRMIPFIVEYEREDFTNNKSPYIPVSVETAGLNVAIDTKTYLLPVSSATETTGSEKLDTLISSLVQLYETLKKIPATDNRRDVKNEQLNSLFKSIRHLQGAQNLEPLVDQMKLAVEQTKEFIKGFKENENLDNLSEAEISEMASEMLIKIQSLQIFEKVFPTILDVFDNPSEDVAEMVDHISEVSSDIVVQKNAMQSLIEDFAQKYIASRRGIEGLKEAEKQVTGITRMFGTTSEIPTAALRTLFTIVENSTNNAKLDTQDAISELEEIKKEVNEWGGLKKLLQTVKKKDKNRLIDEYDPKFYDELKIAMDNGDGEWIEKNIDIEEYQDALFEKRKQQLKYIEQTTFFSDPERNEEKKKELKDKLIKITDIGNVEAYFSQDNYYVMRKFPNKKWITEEFKELQKNEPALKFYNFIRKINEKAKEVGYLQKESVRGFLPYIYKSFSEKLANGGTLSFSDWLTNSLTIDENVAGYGDFNELSGRIEDNLPRYFVREIEDESQISEDLFTNAAIYAKAVIDYEYKSQVEGQIKALYFIEQNKKSIETNVFGRIVRGTANQPKKVPSNEKNADLLLKHIQTTFYGQKYAASGTTDVLLGDWVTRYNEFAEKARKKYNIPFPKLNENTDGKQISVTRTIDTLNHWFRMKNLGLNVASSMSVFFGGNFQALINSGKYYTGKQFLASEWKYASHFKIKDEELHFALIKQFLPVDEELQRRINQLSTSKINANSFSDFMMVLMRRADYSVQYANFLSFMENTIVIDGKLHNARDYYRNSPDYANRYKLPEEQRKKMESEFEEKVQELIDKNGIINKSQVKDGKLAIEGVNFRDPKNLEYRTLIQTIGRKATGNISPENEMLMRMNVIGKSMMVFKNWIPGLVKQRFGGLRYDESVNDWEYGRVRMIIKHLGFFAFARINDIRNIIKGNEEGLKLVMKFYEKQKSDYIESGGDPSKFMSEAQFADAMRLALEMQMKELAILFSSLGFLYAVLPGLAPDDEDREAKNRFNFARRMVDKISDEVWFYYSPMQTQQILNGSIFPSLGLLTDASKVLSSTSKEIWGLVTENDELVEKNYPLKNLMKALPITREVPYYIAMFDADLAKELGIRISTQSRMR